MQLLTSVNDINKTNVARGSVLDKIAPGSLINWFASARPTALHDACSKGLVALATTLVNEGADIEAEDPRHLTPLMLAIEKRDTAMMAGLIQCGARLDNPTRFHGTPLRFAIDQEDEGMVSFLLDKGSNVNAKDRQGRTALH